MRLLRELGRVGYVFAPQLVVLLLPVHRVDRNQESENAGPLDVPQKLQTKSTSLVRALDDARYVGDDERARVAHLHDAQIRAERSKGIVGDLRPRRRDDGQQRRLARVRLPNEANVGNELELELERPLLAIFAGLILSRRLMRGRHEPRVSLSTTSAARNQYLVAVRDHFAEMLSRVEIANHCPGRDGQNRVRAGGAGLVRAGSMVPIFRFPAVAIRVVEQRAEIAVGANAHVASAAAITT